MPEEVRASRTRIATAQEDAVARWFAEQQQDPTKHLDAGAQQLITLVSALYTVVFGMLAFANDPVPAYLARVEVRASGTLVVLSYLVALLASLVVVLPWSYDYSSSSQTQMERVFQAIVRRKRRGLRVALGAFGVGSIALAVLLLLIMFGG